MKQIILTILAILAFLLGSAIPYVLPPHDKGKKFKPKEILFVISTFVLILIAIVLITIFL